MLAAGQAALRAEGHNVAVSDLYATQFNPVAGRGRFLTVPFLGGFKVLAPSIGWSIQSVDRGTRVMLQQTA